MNLADFKAQNPAYAQTPDGKLAYGLWNKFYKGKLPMGQFADKVGLSGEAFKEMIATSKEAGYEPTERTIAAGYVPEGARAEAYLQGATFGFGDEALSTVAATRDLLTGKSEDFGKSYDQYQAQQKQMLEDFRRSAPGEALATEIAGGIATPAGLLRAPAMIERLGAGTRAAVTGATGGAAYGAGTAEGGLEERAKGALEMAVPGAIFGYGTQQVLRGANKTVQAAMNRSVQKPTVESLKTAKQKAYQAVDNSGVRFGKRDMSYLLQQAQKEAIEANYVPEVDAQTKAALKIIESKQGQSVSLGELDKLRQGLWKRYNAAPNEVGIRGMIDALDEVIESKAVANESMKVARIANSRFKKAELLDEAFNTAERQTAASGSGGNILNKYKQAVTSVLNNPKKAKWFSQEEQAAMADFVKGTPSQNLMRLMGKLSPSGNGLMAALHLFSASINPSTLAGAGVGVTAKALSDAQGRRGAEALVQMAGGGAMPRPAPFVPGISAPAGMIGGLLTQE